MMLRKMLATLNLALGTAMTAYYAHELAKYKLDEIANTETVHSARQYVLVRFARGDYYNVKGVETMVYDYKFYKTIEKIHEN